MLFLETWELRRSDETLVFGNAGVTNRNLQAENLFYETDETRKKFDITLMVSQPTFLDGEHVVQEVREAEENSPSGLTDQDISHMSTIKSFSFHVK